jgi:CRP/FNR family transcriptional regulator, cyclic AMP receptor protein
VNAIQHVSTSHKPADVGGIGAELASPPPGKCGQCASHPMCIIKALSQGRPTDAPVPFTEYSFKKGEILSREGEHDSCVKVIKVGVVHLYRGATAQQLNPVAITGRGMVVGLCGLFGQANQVWAVAATGGRFCEVPVDLVSSAIRDDQKGWGHLGWVYAATLGLIAKWTEAINRNNILDRVANSLKLLTEVHGTSTVPIPSHSAMAGLLGTTRESVARALALLEKMGCVRKNYGHSYEVMHKSLAQWLSREPQAAMLSDGEVEPKASSALKANAPNEARGRGRNRAIT